MNYDFNVLLTNVIAVLSRGGSPIDCDICSDSKPPNQFVSCLHCKKEVCLDCCQSYLLTQEFTQCMHCTGRWDEMFIRLYFRRSSWLDLERKSHLKDILMAQDQEHFAHSARFVSFYQQYLTAEKTEKDLNKRFYDASNEYYEVKSEQVRVPESSFSDDVDYTFTERQVRLISLKSHADELRTQWYEAREYKQVLLGAIMDAMELDDVAESLETLNTTSNVLNRRVSLRKCPAAECQGYIEQDHTCLSCQSTICKDCNTAVQDITNHVCDQQVKSSFQAIMKDSKPCPRCSSFIFRDAGCDHMWCVKCNYGFSWKTLLPLANVNNTNHHAQTHFRQQRERAAREGSAFRREVQHDKQMKQFISELTTRVRTLLSKRYPKEVTVSMNLNKGRLNGVQLSQDLRLKLVDIGHEMVKSNIQLTIPSSAVISTTVIEEMIKHGPIDFVASCFSENEKISKLLPFLFEHYCKLNTYGFPEMKNVVFSTGFCLYPEPKSNKILNSSARLRYLANQDNESAYKSALYHNYIQTQKRLFHACANRRMQVLIENTFTYLVDALEKEQFTLPIECDFVAALKKYVSNYYTRGRNNRQKITFETFLRANLASFLCVRTEDPTLKKVVEKISNSVDQDINNVLSYTNSQNRSIALAFDEGSYSAFVTRTKTTKSRTPATNHPDRETSDDDERDEVVVTVKETEYIYDERATFSTKSQIDFQDATINNKAFRALFAATNKRKRN